jgi:hypothetical protein
MSRRTGGSFEERLNLNFRLSAGGAGLKTSRKRALVARAVLSLNGWIFSGSGGMLDTDDHDEQVGRCRGVRVPGPLIPILFRFDAWLSIPVTRGRAVLRDFFKFC